MFSNTKVFRENFTERLETKFSKRIEDASRIEIYKTIGSMLKDKIYKNWMATNKTYFNNKEKQVYYFSMEFLLGRLMESNLLNTGTLDVVRNGLEELGIKSEAIFKEEHDAGLGNGGLGRLAACFLDSLASLNLPGHGCGIRYKYGLFQQKMVNGNQVELPDYWLKEDYVWEVRRSDKAVEVHFGGEVSPEIRDGRLSFRHENFERVMAIPYDVPVVGFDNKTVNTLRLWSAETTTQDFDFASVQQSDYYNYIEYKRSVESISEFLYPDDSYFEGKMLRLKQQYFLVSAGIQSILRSFKNKYQLSLSELPNRVTIQINDTHPSLVIPELMRILMDREGFGWDEAWEITTKSVAYTNHTTLSEALEKWPVNMVKQLLPRIYMIIHEINERFCKHIWETRPELRDLIPDLAIIAYEEVRMSNLAIVGSFSVNGVAKVHTEIIKKSVMKNFYTVYPEKFNNKTNGITHRRWLMNANPNLATVINEVIGTRWIKEPKELIGLLKFVSDSSFQEKVASVKRDNKITLAKIIKEQTNIVVDENSIFDVQIKRLHGYKRQLLNIFHIMHLYNVIKENPNLNMIPRTFIFGAKAAPSYHFAKKVIKLIVTAANIINHDPDVRDKLKVVFLENYSVSLAERIIPAADISEQISTASKEASGTGNMKLMMNGALTLGTMDGANIEIHDFVGRDNIFIFGLSADEVLEYYQNGQYHARDIYNTDGRIRSVLDQLVNGFFMDEVAFKDIYYSILSNNDEYFVLKDFDGYAEAQELIDQNYRDQKLWLRKSITNIAHSGKFSSDRTISQYASEIWSIKPTII